MSGLRVGLRVVVSPTLPIVPSTPEVCARIVRHALRHVLDAAGEEVGPSPHARTHAYALPGELVVSAEMFAHLRGEVAS